MIWKVSISELVNMFECSQDNYLSTVQMYSKKIYWMYKITNFEDYVILSHEVTEWVTWWLVECAIHN